MRDPEERILSRLESYVESWRLRPRSVEALLVACLTWWAISFLWPGRDTLTSAPAFHTMDALMPEIYWGLLMLALALPQAYGLATWRRDWSVRRLIVRRSCLMLSAAWWAFITVQFGHDNPHNTGVGVYALFCVASIWTFAVVDVPPKGRDVER